MRSHALLQSTPTRDQRPRRACTKPKPLPENPAYTAPLLKLANDEASRTSPLPFQPWADSIAEFFHVSKFAEASFGEVYRLCLKDPQPGLEEGDESVLKFIALKPPLADSNAPEDTRPARGKAAKRRIEHMSNVCDVASEVRLLQHMSSVPGFANFRDIKVMQGRLPAQFVSAWRQFNSKVKKSDFPDPGRRTSYDEDQLWAIVEMQDAGQDLEGLTLETVWECWDVFWSVALTLAKGEEYAAFEVLIAPSMILYVHILTKSLFSIEICI